MDRRSPKSLWRDYGVPMQDPNAFSLQYYKDTSRDPAKPKKKQPAKKKKVDYTDHTGILKIQKPKKASRGGLLKKAGYGAKLGLLGMGQYQDKAPQPTKRDAPADKIHNNIKIVKRKKRVEKIAFAH